MSKRYVFDTSTTLTLNVSNFVEVEATDLETAREKAREQFFREVNEDFSFWNYSADNTKIIMTEVHERDD